MCGHYRPANKRLRDSPQIAALSTRPNPFVLWHLLSLDAPTVAALWTRFVARESHVPLPRSSILGMAIAVWMLYAADRLLDTRSIHSHRELEERHFYHRHHSRAFVCGIILAALILVALLPRLGTPSLHLYAILGAMLLAYFALIHSSANPRNGRRLPKELAVGVFFSAAIFIPTVSRQPALRPALLPAAALFAILCSLNCLFIYAWEHPVTPHSTHPSTRVALRFLPVIAITATVWGFAAIVWNLAAPIDSPPGWAIFAACAASASLLLLLHRSRHRLTPLTLRTAADLCLLTPLFFLGR